MDDESYCVDIKQESPFQFGYDAPRVTLEQLRSILYIVFGDGGGSSKPHHCLRINNMLFYPDDLMDEVSFEGKFVGIVWMP
jgi:hypothetical protein